MSTPLILALALLLDAVMGEPRWLWSRLPHPAVLMGHAVGWCDAQMNRGEVRRLKGVIATVLLSAGAILTGIILQLPGWPVEVIAAAILLAHRSLVQHVQAVGDALRMSEAEARRAVARIVGRDTGQLDQPAIARGAIESAAENFSDGVVAPAFWFLLGGLPGLILYKVINTADSMIGYKNDRYGEFGWAAARFDDLLNLIPARLTALIFALPHGLLNHWREIAADARLHRSPNAGWPEAAAARVLNVALSGPRAYHGQMRDFPFVNANGNRQIGADATDAACRLLWRGWATLLGATVLLALVA